MRHHVRAACLALVVVVSACVAGAEAASAGQTYPMDDNIYKTSNYPGKDFASDTYLVWHSSLGGTTTADLSAPTLNSDGSRAYVTDQTGTLYCLAITPTGDFFYDFRASAKGSLVKWDFKGTAASGAQGNAFQPALSRDESMVFFSTAAHVYAVDAESGSMKWVMPYQYISSPILAVDEFVVFGTSQTAQVVYAFANNGTFYDKFYKHLFHTGPSASVLSRASADPENNILYATSDDTSVYAIQVGIPTPRCIWGQVVDNQHGIYSSPVIDKKNNRLFITTVHVGAGSGGVGGGLFSVSTNPFSHTSTQLLRVNSTIQGSAVLISEARVAFGDNNGNVYCVNTNTTDYSNNVVWRKKLGSNLVATPITDGNTIVVASNDGTSGTLYALDAKTGDTQWTFKTEGQLLTDPVPSPDGSIVVADNKGNIYALWDKGGKSMIATYISVAALLVIGLFACIGGYRFFRFTATVLSFVATFFAILALVYFASHNGFAVWKSALIALSVALLVSAFVTFYPKGAPTYFAIAFVVYAANDVVVSMSKGYGDLGWKIIVAECAALVLFTAMSFAKTGKKFMCILGIAAISATFIIGAVASFLPEFKNMYVGIGYAVVFVFSVLLQAGYTGREDFHLPKSERTEEDSTGKSGSGGGDAEDYTRLEAGDAPAGGDGPLGPVRRGSDRAFAADDRFRGDEFNMGGGMAHSSGVAVLPGQRAATQFSGSGPTNITGSDDRGQLITARFVAGKMGLRLSPFHDLGGASPAIVRSVVGQAQSQGVMAGDFVVAVGRLSINPAMHYEDVMGAIQAERRPLEIQFLRPYSRSLDLDGETRTGSGGGMFGGW